MNLLWKNPILQIVYLRQLKLPEKIKLWLRNTNNLCIFSQRVFKNLAKFKIAKIFNN